MPKTGLFGAIEADEAKLKEMEAAEGGDDDAADGGDDDSTVEDGADGGDDEGDEGGDEDAAPGKKPEAKAKDPKAAADPNADPKKADPKAKDGKGESENSVAAQLRIAQRQLKQQEARIAELSKGAPAPAAAPAAPAKADGEQPAPKQPTAEERLAKIEREQEQGRLEQAAVDELGTYEADFMKVTPDYQNASDHMIKTMGGAIRAMYPNATNQQVGNFLKRQILGIAASAVQQGLDPAEQLYKLSMERYGYTKAKSQPKADDTRKRLERSADTRKRSANGLGGGGQGANPGATVEEAAKMSLADFSKLKPGEIDQMIAESLEA